MLGFVFVLFCFPVGYRDRLLLTKYYQLHKLTNSSEPSAGSSRPVRICMAAACLSWKNLKLNMLKNANNPGLLARLLQEQQVDVITVTHGLKSLWTRGHQHGARRQEPVVVASGGIYKMIFKMSFYVFISLIFQSSVTPAVICLLLLVLSELFKSPFPDTRDKIQSACTNSCRCGRSAASPCRCPPVSRTLIKTAH